MGRKLSVTSGEVYGKLTVTIGRCGSKVVCRCECGETCRVMPRDLRSGNIRACEKCRKKRTTKHGHKWGPLEVGDWIGGLQATERLATTEDGRAMWRFECVCGGGRITTATEMKRYITPLCGRCDMEEHGKVLAYPFGLDYYKQLFHAFHEHAVKEGYKLYNISVSPPELIYDPERKADE